MMVIYYKFVYVVLETVHYSITSKSERMIIFMKRLGSLLNDFYTRNLEYAQYLDTRSKYPSLTIKRNYYSMRPWNPFAIKVSFKDKNDDEFDFSFLVYKNSAAEQYYWTGLSPRGIFVDPVGPFPTWNEALDALEVHCMEYFDTNEPMWDNLVEM